ncbi:MAG: 5-oxoprolinase subunit PxpB [Chloroflexi bacterium]|nr:5-oxoprolinase subunit PxpB [Chloroflexota bacterium]
MYQQPRFRLGGDRALYIEVGDAISPEVNRRVKGLLDAIDKAAIEGVEALSPTYRSILVYYDPLKIPLEELKQRLSDLGRALPDASSSEASIFEIPTLYGGEFGPDLDFVASHTGLSPEEVIRIHAGTDYLVYMVGFNPGFPYLGGMSDKIAAPRLETPRIKIPAGSVGIAETQTGIYPLESPGGWRLIGRSPLKMFDPSRDPPALVEAGDLVRFVSIDEARYQEIQGEVEAGRYRVTIHRAA